MNDVTPLDRCTGDVRTVCANVGIDLRGDEGHPYHCGDRMTTKSGLFGVDMAVCESCKLEVRWLVSPHVNGGHIPDGSLSDEEYERQWVAIRDGEPVEVSS